ncbi:MAG: molybdopterin-guanine dinucleotide biosynthesis protein A [Proteobacteria bacterium]|nr:molybdopterin-guanine dinucleotide biosynthesis protein A [Pseudomonadota bacterium]
MIRLGLFCLLLLAAGPAQAQPADRHEGYYYPEANSQETYVARAKVLLDASRDKRLDFVNGLTTSQLGGSYAPYYVVFAKGERADRLIVVSLQAGQLDTVYRARALLAQLTSLARGTPLLQDYGVDNLFTFLDVLKLMGFSRVTLSDGDKFAHQILIR